MDNYSLMIDQLLQFKDDINKQELAHIDIDIGEKDISVYLRKIKKSKVIKENYESNIN